MNLLPQIQIGVALVLSVVTHGLQSLAAALVDSVPFICLSIDEARYQYHGATQTVSPSATMTTTPCREVSLRRPGDQPRKVLDEPRIQWIKPEKRSIVARENICFKQTRQTGAGLLPRHPR